MPEPLYYSFNSLPESLHFVLKQKKKATLLTCSSRDAFLQHLLVECQNERPDSSRYQLGGRQLLDPSIQLLAASRLINLVFAPSLSHLRAFLSNYPPETSNPEGEATGNSDMDWPDLLVILNPLAAHRDSGEFSAQGLSRTFALAVETVARHNISLHVIEISEPGPVDNPLDGAEGGSDRIIRQSNVNPWKIHVPLLNESVRKLGDERVWAGKSIEASRVIEQWFKAGNQSE